MWGWGTSLITTISKMFVLQNQHSLDNGSNQYCWIINWKHKFLPEYIKNWVVVKNLIFCLFGKVVSTILFSFLFSHFRTVPINGALFLWHHRCSQKVQKEMETPHSMGGTNTFIALFAHIWKQVFQNILLERMCERRRYNVLEWRKCEMKFLSLCKIMTS